MAYRRRYSYAPYEREVKKVQVSITWDNVTNAAYKVFATNFGKNFNKWETVVMLIKTSIASSDREYDPDAKTWYISEKHIQAIRQICEAIPEFEVIFVEKPEQVAAQKFHNKEDDYAEFKRLVSFAHIQFDDTTELAIAIKVYRKAAMYLHPDRNPDMAQEMSSLNEVWARLKTTYFK